MSDKITLSTVGTVLDTSTAAATINANNAIIVAGMDNTLSRNGTAPNQMQAPIDMNSNRILNLPQPITSLEPLRLTDANVINGGGVINISPLPVGGTTGQTLTKNTGTNYDVSWTSSNVPVGGTTGQILSKNSNTNYDTGWTSLSPAVGGLPTGGTAGQTLIKNSSTNFDASWQSTAAVSSNTYVVENYGAKADFKNLFDGSINIGTALFTSASGPFVPGDVGKLMNVVGAGATGGVSSGVLFTNISGYISPTQVTLGNLAVATVTSANFHYSTNSNVGIQAACDLAKVTGGDVVFSSAGMYGMLQLNLTNPTRAFRLIGIGPSFWGTRLIPMGNVNAVIDATGHDAFHIRNLTIGGSNFQIARPTFGLLLAPSNLIQGMDVPYFESFTVDGFFTSAGIYIDRVFGGNCVNCGFGNYWQNSSPGSAVTAIFTRNNLFGATSSYTTISTAGAGPNLNWVFERCEFHSIDPASGAGVNYTIWMDGLGDSTFLGGIIAGGYTAPILFGPNCIGITFMGVEFSYDMAAGYNYVFAGNGPNYISMINCAPSYHTALQGTSPAISNLFTVGRV